MDRDWIIIFILGLGWGTSFFFMEVLLNDLGPYTIGFLRVSTAALTCWVILAATGRARAITSGQWGKVFAIGALMFALPMSAFPLGQQYVASGIAGIINALTPVLVVIISHFWPEGERATQLKVFGVFAGFLGIIFITIPELNSGEGSRLLGVLLCLLAPLGYGFGTNLIRSAKSMDMGVVAAWSFTFASILILPVMMLSEGLPSNVSGTSILSVLILGPVLTGIFFMIAFAILPRAGATKTSTVTFIAPLSAVFLGWFVLNENLQILHFAGMAAIFTGLIFIDGRIARQRN
ncbi:MAG: DMT family transporter [Boseongicola sp.]|nr:DMT family transporter [Boseongicola sp.]MDD9979669.1 DMT family transporter [Boseongicola sp.]